MVVNSFVPPGNLQRGLFIVMVRGFGNNIQTPPPPLTTPSTQSVQSWGYYSHFTLKTTLHGTYLVATRIPFGQASTHCAAPSFGPSRPPLPSSSCLLTNDLRLSYLKGPPLGSCACRPVRNHEMRRFIRESINVGFIHA
jgi:hypothetical protein